MKKYDCFTASSIAEVEATMEGPYKDYRVINILQLDSIPPLKVFIVREEPILKLGAG